MLLGGCMPHNLCLSEQLMYCTVRIECILSSGQMGTGTGFFYRFCDTGTTHVPAIVTNKHVVNNSVHGSITLHFGDDNDCPIARYYETFKGDNFGSRWIPHPDSSVDLCIFPIAQLINNVQKQGKKLFFIPLDNSLILNDQEMGELTALEDIVMVGYPNGIWDSVNNFPLIRRGITATHPNVDYNGQSMFLIDAACFPGSSGSPVFLFNTGGYTTRTGGTILGGTRIKLLGIHFAGPQYIASGEIRVINTPNSIRPIALSGIPNNLGFVIKAKQLVAFDKVLSARKTA